MKCEKCGCELPDEILKCPECGETAVKAADESETGDKTETAGEEMTAAETTESAEPTEEETGNADNTGDSGGLELEAMINTETATELSESPPETKTSGGGVRNAVIIAAAAVVIAALIFCVLNFTGGKNPAEFVNDSLLNAVNFDSTEAGQSNLNLDSFEGKLFSEIYNGLAGPGQTVSQAQTQKLLTGMKKIQFQCETVSSDKKEAVVAVTSRPISLDICYGRIIDFMLEEMERLGTLGEEEVVAELIDFMFSEFENPEELIVTNDIVINLNLTKTDSGWQLPDMEKEKLARIFFNTDVSAPETPEAPEAPEAP